jgi:hypothetical protein
MSAPSYHPGLSSPTLFSEPHDFFGPLVVMFKYGEREGTKTGTNMSVNMDFYLNTVALRSFVWLNFKLAYQSGNPGYWKVSWSFPLASHGSDRPVPSGQAIANIDTNNYGVVSVVLDINSIFSNPQAPIFNVFANSATPSTLIPLNVIPGGLASALASSKATFIGDNKVNITTYGCDTYIAHGYDDACCIGASPLLTTCKPVCENNMQTFCSIYSSKANPLQICKCLDAAKQTNVTGPELSCLSACGTPGVFTPDSVGPCTATICANIINTTGANNVINDANFNATCQDMAKKNSSNSNSSGTDTTPDSDSDTSTSKAPIIIAVVVLLILLIAGGVFAYMYFYL